MTLHTKLHVLCDTNVPKTTSARHNFPCWILPSTVKMIEKKDRLWKLEKEIKSQIKTVFIILLSPQRTRLNRILKNSGSILLQEKGVRVYQEE